MNTLTGVTPKNGGVSIKYKHHGATKSVWLMREDVAGRATHEIRAVILQDMRYEGIDSDPFTAQEWGDIYAGARRAVA